MVARQKARRNRNAPIDSVWAFRADCLNVKSEEEHEVLQKAELSARLIQRTTSEAPQRLCTTSDLTFTTRRSATALRMWLAMCTGKARSDRPGANWMPGYGRYPNPQPWAWEGRAC